MSIVSTINRKIRRFSCLCLCCVISIAEGSDFKEWESADGRILEARILSRENGVVRMERIDGTVYTIPVERFSKAAQQEIRAWTPPPIEVPEPDKAVLILETNEGRGTGFLVQALGETWLYTNQHVIADGQNVKAFDTDGVSVELGSLEIATDRDLARFSTRTNSGLILADGMRSGDKVVVYGNSQGSGLITRDEGRVLGIAPEVIEVSAEIVSGNSGGPVIDKDGKVVGISSFVTFGEASGDPTMKGTRFENPRRFALRLDGVIDFRKVSSDEFQEVYDNFQREIEVFDESLALIEVILRSPENRVMVGAFDSPPVVDVAEDHNTDIDRKRLSSDRLLDTLEDSLELSEESLEAARRAIPDARFGWMESEVERREKLLEGWRDLIRRVELSFD